MLRRKTVRLASQRVPIVLDVERTSRKGGKTDRVTRNEKGLKTDLRMENNERLFYRQRTRFNELVANGQEDTAEGAALFYYLNRTGFNGLCRFNSKGEFNVPFGKYVRIGYTHDFTSYKDAFADWELSTGDFESLVISEGDFIYADPPYDVEFTQYSKEQFGWAQQVRLAEWLAAHRGPVAVSNQATERIVRLYVGLGFEVERATAPRRISCTGDRKLEAEILALKGV